VAQRRDRGQDLGGVTAAEVAAAASAAVGRRVRLPDGAVARALDPAAFVAKRDGPGGPGPKAVDAMLRDARAALEASRRAAEALRDAIARARARRERALADALSSHRARQRHARGADRR